MSIVAKRKTFSKPCICCFCLFLNKVKYSSKDEKEKSPFYLRYKLSHQNQWNLMSNNIHFNSYSFYILNLILKIIQKCYCFSMIRLIISFGFFLLHFLWLSIPGESNDASLNVKTDQTKCKTLWIHTNV